jgi:DNA invertase Pin-like site-specific DNA recombinase
MPEPVKVALYLRQSLDKTGEGLAVDRQRDACRKLAEARDWTVVAEYPDHSVSATNGTRPRWAQMLADAERGQFDVILAWALDRLTRSVKDTEHLVALCERTGVRVATVQGDIDLTTDQGRLVGRILSAVAKGEIERKSARQQLANRQRAEAGLPPVGPRALGWERDGRTLVPYEADLVRRGFELILSGGSLRSVVRLWNDAGLRTAPRRSIGSPKDAPRVGQRWAPYSVRAVLRNPRYAGLRAVKGDVVGQGAWPAIVADETWQAVKAKLEDPTRRNTPSTARKYLLSGLALCGQCGATVNAGGLNRYGERVYKCSRTKHLFRRAEPVEAYVQEVVLERLSRPDLADFLAADRPDLSRLSIEATTLRTRRDQLAEDYAEGALTRSQLLAGSRRIVARLTGIEAALADAAQATVLAAFTDGAAEVVWHGLDLDQRRAVIDILCTVVIYSPGQGTRTFRPETIEIKPKEGYG